MPENFRQIAAAPPEDVKIAGVGIAPQLLLNLKRQTLHAPAHVGVAHRDPDAAPRRNRDHRRSAFKAAAIADEGASAWMRTCASFSSTSITEEAKPRDDNDKEGAAAGSTTTGANPPPAAVTASRLSRRHLKIRLVQISSRRATSAITAPGSEIAARIRARSSLLHRRRRSAPEITVIGPMPRS